MSIENKYDYIFKLLLIGDSGVGKSSIVLRFADDTFTDSYISTIGVDFKIRTITIRNKIIKLQIWDTAGQERFRTITTSYYRGAHAIIIVFDITDKLTFDNVENWLENINLYANNNIQKILIGNKSDLKMDRNLNQDLINSLINNYQLKYIETSAKNDYNINLIFEEISNQLLKAINEDRLDKYYSKNLITYKVSNKNSGCC